MFFAVLAIAAALRVPADDPRVVVVGHHAQHKGAVTLSWSATELRVRFTGTSVALDVDERAAGADGDRYAAFVDGARSDLALPKGKGLVVVAKDLTPGEHELSFVKRTEPLVGNTVIRAIVLDDGANLLPVPARKRRIEVIGDSLATAFGVQGAGPGCAFSADTEDATQGFAGLLGKRFDADLVVLAWSGRGVYRDFDGKSDKETVPAMFAKSERLDRAPDVVIVELGANDFLEGVPDRAKFMAGYHALLDAVRKRYPASAVLLVSPMSTSADPADALNGTAPAWLNAVVHKRGEPKLSFMKLPARDDTLPLGCVWHPGPQMQQKLADAVATELATRMGW